MKYITNLGGSQDVEEQGSVSYLALPFHLLVETAPGWSELGSFLLLLLKFWVLCNHQVRYRNSCRSMDCTPSPVIITTELWGKNTGTVAWCVQLSILRASELPMLLGGMAACSVLSPSREQPENSFLGSCPGRQGSSSQDTKEKVGCVTPHPRRVLTSKDGGTLPSPLAQRKDKTRATPVFWKALGLFGSVCSEDGPCEGGCFISTPVQTEIKLLCCLGTEVLLQCTRMGGYLWLTEGEYIFFNNIDYKETFLRVYCSWWACKQQVWLDLSF